MSMDREELLALRDAVEARGAGAGPYDRAAELKTAAQPDPERIEPKPQAQSRWVKPLSCYERRETTIVEGLRYG
jgi:hypothetical protein